MQVYFHNTTRRETKVLLRGCTPRRLQAHVSSANLAKSSGGTSEWSPRLTSIFFLTLIPPPPSIPMRLAPVECLPQPGGGHVLGKLGRRHMPAQRVPFHRHTSVDRPVHNFIARPEVVNTLACLPVIGTGEELDGSDEDQRGMWGRVNATVGDRNQSSTHPGSADNNSRLFLSSTFHLSRARNTSLDFYRRSMCVWFLTISVPCPMKWRRAKGEVLALSAAGSCAMIGQHQRKSVIAVTVRCGRAKRKAQSTHDAPRRRRSATGSISCGAPPPRC